MTVADLIARLSEFPADMHVVFTADMGCIVSGNPTIEIDKFDAANREVIDVVYIEINWKKSLTL